MNIHWFCDKLDLTGSIYQAVNGAFLVGTFLGCRLIWGNMSSFWVFYDIFHCIWQGHTTISQNQTGAPKNYSTQDLLRIYGDEQGQRLAFAGGQQVPLWLGLIYLASNLTLNSLNIFWFGKMIETIRKRFDPPLGTKGLGDDALPVKIPEAADPLVDPRILEPDGSLKAAVRSFDHTMNGTAEATRIQTSVHGDGSTKSVEVTGSRSLRTRRKA